MTYDICYTETAINDLRNIVHYVSHILRNDRAASSILNQLTASISKLDVMPERYPLNDRKMSKCLGNHKMPVKNYVVFYNIDEPKHIVWIIRIMNCLINTNG